MSNEHEKMHDTPQPPFSDARPEAAAGPAMTDAANQNAPLSQEAVMQAATARIAGLEAEVAELKDRWMRSEAEIANVRARSRREVDETRQYAVQKFAADVVEVAENLRRGLDSLPPPEPDQPEIVGKLREGLEGVERNFVMIMERNGIKRVDPTGTPFDPNMHQAMAEQASEAHPPGTVLHAWTQAWTLNGRLLRPAMVVVAKALAAELDPEGNRSAKLDTTA
jgi:molecular chaperone GrpE